MFKVFIFPNISGARGKWFELPISESNVRHSLGISSEDVELIISDYDFPFEVKNMTLGSCNAMVAKIETFPDYIAKNLKQILENINFDDLVSIASDIKFYKDVSEEYSLGVVLCDNGTFEVPGNLVGFIDYKKLAQSYIASHMIIFVSSGVLELPV